MKKVPEVGDIITLKEFCFDNKAGGTGMSDSKWNEKYSDVVQAVVTKEWNDYECGQRGWGIADPKDKKLKEYLTRNSTPDAKGYFRIYWSEFDILNCY